MTSRVESDAKNETDLASDAAAEVVKDAVKEETASEQPSPSFFQVTMSVLAAALGVQTDKNRERDFSQSSPLPYIVGGLLFTVLFVLTIAGVVMLVLPD